MQASWRILVLGGYGIFGKRICTILSKDPLWHVYIGGRDIQKAEKLAARIKADNSQANIYPFAINWETDEFAQTLFEHKINIVIHAAGPFQGQNYKVAQDCIDLKIHYIDLADAREFVSTINQLNEKAIANGVAVISGASSVPGLSSAVIDNYIKKFSDLREIEIGIAPANKIERGEATIAAILSYTGKPFTRLEKGKWVTVYGWQNIHQHYYGDNVGMRWQANCDVPDLALFPENYPSLHTVAFHAGLEVSFLHITLWLMSFMSRANLVKDWNKFRKPIIAMSHWLDKFGTDTGGMYIRMYGSNHRYQPLELKWTLVAAAGHGPYIPIIPSVILAKKLREGLIKPGARPCLGLFSLDEFDSIASNWKIYHIIEEVEF